VRALLVSPLGFLIGLALGALGGGGSILAVPVLVFAAGQDPRAATTTSLMLVGTASAIGMVAHWKAGRVRVGLGVMFGLFGVGGSIAGSAVNHRLDPNLLLLAFSLLVVVAAWRMVTGCPTCSRTGERRELEAARSGSVRTGSAATAVAERVAVSLDVRSLTEILLVATTIGFLTGLFGVGGGFIIVPALTLILKLPMPEAIGTSLLAVAITTAAALATRLATAPVDWQVAAPFTIAAVAGVLAGERVAGRMDAEKSVRRFAGLLILVAFLTAAKAIGALL
jgi:uncharacterized protein